MDNPKELVVEGFKIARRVLERIAEVSAGNVSDVSGVGAINVEQAGKEIVIDIGITVDHGAKYQEVASLVQQSIADAIKDMTGLDVKEVNVSVEKLDFREK